MNAEDIAGILNNLSEITCAGSLGYLPQMFFAKWFVDNPKLPENRAKLVFYRYDERVEDRGYDEKNLMHLSRAMFGFRPDVLFDKAPEEFSSADSQVSRGLAASVLKQTENTLLSLDLSGAAVPRKEVARGFDLYLHHVLTGRGGYRLGVSESPGVAERIAAGIAEYFMPYSVYDPFCKFGTLLSGINAPQKTASDETLVYASIAKIRAALADEYDIKILPENHLEAPLTDEHGRLRRFDLVVSDLTGIGSDKETALFQTDVHKRFQTYCPELSRLSPSAAFCHAIASAGSGKCILIGNAGGNFRGPGILDDVSSEGITSLLSQDLPEAVIDVAVSEEKPVTGEFPMRPGRGREIRRIYVFNDEKEEERCGKILFINATDVPASAVVSRVLSCVKTFEEVPGFSAVVSCADILAAESGRILRRPGETVFSPKQYTACIAKPKETEISHILRDIKRLEEQRVSLMKNIEEIAASLTEEK
ncbi:MAG TPA: hypothetical protein O0X19_01850 [Methanocorpusculum sp.]|nr:SAM-dependent DNA methyltransferase [Candidatus Methanocorpusculum equi]MCQ2357817.1 hypothetical protein [Methanocorpusculum sp.]HJJ33113.1 hypothetical protein [Methanocorpusculum sp.]